MAAWIQPAFGPRSAVGVVRAMAAIAAALAHTDAALALKHRTPSSGTAAAVIGVRAKAAKQHAVTVTAIAYQRRGVRLTSTTGPARNIQVLGNR